MNNSNGISEQEESDEPLIDHSSQLATTPGLFYSAKRNLTSENIFSFPAPAISSPFVRPSAKKTKDQKYESPLARSNPSPSSQDSPNQILADFFQKKGSEPLSEIETAGVMSIITSLNAERPQAYSSASSTTPTHNSHLSKLDQTTLEESKFSPRGSIEEFKNANNLEDRSKSLFSVQKSMNSSPTYNPLFKSRKVESSSQIPLSSNSKKPSLISSSLSPYPPVSETLGHKTVNPLDHSSESGSAAFYDGRVKKAAKLSPQNVPKQLVSLARIPRAKDFINPSGKSLEIGYNDIPEDLISKPRTQAPSLRTKNASQINQSTPRLRKQRSIRSSSLQHVALASDFSTQDKDKVNELRATKSFYPLLNKQTKSSTEYASSITPTWAVPDFIDDDDDDDNSSGGSTNSSSFKPVLVSPAKPLYPSMKSSGTTPSFSPSLFKFGLTATSSELMSNDLEENNPNIVSCESKEEAVITDEPDDNFSALRDNTNLLVNADNSRTDSELEKYSARFLFPPVEAVSPPKSISQNRLDTYKDSFYF